TVTARADAHTAVTVLISTISSLFAVCHDCAKSRTAVTDLQAE
ncbi:hypothetical protein A2U01_0056634, partial [Trifolium medium]|nr:hypothetical protein [Trifolium medium]